MGSVASVRGGRLDREDVPHLGNAFERMDPPVLEADTRAGHEILHGRGHDYLIGAGKRCQAGGDGDGDPTHVVIEQLEAVLDNIPAIRMPTGRRRRRPGKVHADKAYDQAHWRVAGWHSAAADPLRARLRGFCALVLLACSVLCCNTLQRPTMMSRSECLLVVRR
jgi:hypothetical protein